jgi:hypothetical protein
MSLNGFESWFEWIMVGVLHTLQRIRSAQAAQQNTACRCRLTRYTGAWANVRLQLGHHLGAYRRAYELVMIFPD